MAASRVSSGSLLQGFLSDLRKSITIVFRSWSSFSCLGTGTTFDCDSQLDSDFTTLKDDCKAFLNNCGFPVPQGRIIYTLEEAFDAIKEIDYPVAVKLNSSDFQKGGFTFDECLQVVDRLDAASLDLLEISGGSYEQPMMMGMEGLEPAFEQPE